MWEKIIDRLITVKSITTLILTAVFAYLAATGVVPADKFQDIFYVIIAFYFGTQVERRDSGTISE